MYFKYIRNLKIVQAKWRLLWLAKLKHDINIQTALTLSGRGGGNGVEVQGAACHGLEGVVDALWNQDDLGEGVGGSVPTDRDKRNTDTLFCRFCL